LRKDLLLNPSSILTFLQRFLYEIFKTDYKIKFIFKPSKYLQIFASKEYDYTCSLFNL